MCVVALVGGDKSGGDEVVGRDGEGWGRIEIFNCGLWAELWLAITVKPGVYCLWA